MILTSNRMRTITSRHGIPSFLCMKSNLKIISCFVSYILIIIDEHHILKEVKWRARGSPSWQYRVGGMAKGQGITHPLVFLNNEYYIDKLNIYIIVWYPPYASIGQTCCRISKLKLHPFPSIPLLASFSVRSLLISYCFTILIILSLAGSIPGVGELMQASFPTSNVQFSKVMALSNPW